METVSTMFGSKERRADKLAVTDTARGLRARRKMMEEGDITEQDPAEAFKAGYTERMRRDGAH